jgi:DNA-binding PadR family transcriptional regulator
MKKGRTQFQILRMLEKGEIHKAKIRAQLEKTRSEGAASTSKAATNRYLRELEEEGLIRVASDVPNGLPVLCSITPDGQELRRHLEIEHKATKQAGREVSRCEVRQQVEQWMAEARIKSKRDGLVRDLFAALLNTFGRDVPVREVIADFYSIWYCLPKRPTRSRLRSILTAWVHNETIKLDSEGYVTKMRYNPQNLRTGGTIAYYMVRARNEGLLRL